jgi:hypothetical protein
MQAYPRSAGLHPGSYPNPLFNAFMLIFRAPQRVFLCRPRPCFGASTFALASMLSAPAEAQRSKPERFEGFTNGESSAVHEMTAKSTKCRRSKKHHGQNADSGFWR